MKFERFLAFTAVKPGMLVQRRRIRGTPQCTVKPHDGSTHSVPMVVVVDELPRDGEVGEYEPCEQVPTLTGYDERVAMLIRAGEYFDQGTALVSNGDGTLKRAELDANPKSIVGYADEWVTGPSSFSKLIWVRLRKERIHSTTQIITNIS